MTQEYLEQMKADLLEIYKEELCEESVEAINKASTPEEFIGLLAKFAAFLNYKAIPTIDWVLKWFNTYEYRRLARECGVYFEGAALVTNPTKPIVVIGDANISLMCSVPSYFNVMLQDKAKCEVTTLSNCTLRIRQRNQSQVNILHKHNLSHIKINKI